jgi:hypothetical protein
MNCKPGDIAICISGRHEGKIGTVISPFAGGMCGGVPFDRIPADAGLIWVFEAAGVFEVGGIEYKQGPFADSQLKPVSGLPDPSEDVAQEAPAEIALSLLGLP